ncbi:zupT, partial [Symbiodinium natans]
MHKVMRPSFARTGRRLQVEGEGDAGFALALTCAAGMATTIGAAMAFCVDTSDSRVFAICLALSAGVMTYVSFVEIIGKADESFQEAGISESDSFSLATLVLFLGLLASMLLELVATYFFHRAHSEKKAFEKGNAEDVMQAHSDPDQLANAIQPTSAGQGSAGSSVADHQDIEVSPTADEAPGQSRKPLGGTERMNMLQMAAFSGVAIALHNFPEGLATFVATMADPSFGPPMAFAIAIHNIPEGLAVAAPILKATNSRSKAFLWAFLSGMSEPLGGLLGWLVLRELVGPVTFAILFGIIAGVMIHISFKKLLPTALKYDP